MKRGLILLGLMLLALVIVPHISHGVGDAAAGVGHATFVVLWYDVGKAALEGRPGVLNVESGWHGFSEVNRVIFDPQKITVEEMADRLKEAGTYVRTLEPAGPEQKE